MFHANISASGAICLDILKDQWSPSMTIEKAMVSLQLLLGEPNTDDPLNLEAATLYQENKEEFGRRAKQFMG